MLVGFEFSILFEDLHVKFRAFRVTTDKSCWA
jgi:hypothetical protein